MERMTKQDLVTVFAVLLSVTCTGLAAHPLVVPKIVTVRVGTTARFNCTALHNEPVHWTTKPYGSADTYDIYIGKKYLLDGYGTSGRFSVEVNDTLRRYDLVIKDIRQSDGGVFTCVDKRGLGKKALAELIVWDTLTCQPDQRQDSYMGENVFGLGQDAVGFTCRMNYKGNLRPQLVWSVGGTKLNGTQGNELGIASSSLSLVATRKFGCANLKVTFDGDDTGVLWTSETIRVRYAILKNEGVKECPGFEDSLECNPSCSHKLETVNGRHHCAAIYSTGLDFRSFYFQYKSIHSSKKDAANSIFRAGLVTFFIFLTLLTVICVRKELQLRTYAEVVSLKINETHCAVHQDDSSQQCQENKMLISSMGL